MLDALPANQEIRTPRPTVFDTFTPRRALVNGAMYVPRPPLERALAKALRCTKHIAIHGPSGSGKSWLYKRFFAQSGHSFVSVDLNLVPILGLGGTLALAIGDEEAAQSRSVGDYAGFTRLYGKAQAMPQAIKPIVFENVEQVANDPDTLQWLAAFIMLLDSGRFAEQGVLLLFVGTQDVVSLITRHHGDTGSLSNRVTTLPPVGPLTLDETQMLVTRGLFERLALTSDLAPSELARQVAHLSKGKAQRVHEICYEIGFDAIELHEGRVTGSALHWLDPVASGQKTAA